MALYFKRSILCLLIGLFALCLVRAVESRRLFTTTAARITRIERKALPTPQRVYNLSVSKNETYYVSALPLLVHNCTFVKDLGEGHFQNASLVRGPDGKLWVFKSPKNQAELTTFTDEAKALAQDPSGFGAKFGGPATLNGKPGYLQEYIPYPIRAGKRGDLKLLEAARRGLERRFMDLKDFNAGIRKNPWWKFWNRDKQAVFFDAMTRGDSEIDDLLRNLLGNEDWETIAGTARRPRPLPPSPSR